MLSEIDKDKLKHYFENREDIAFAFLYGSQVYGYATSLSDVDIAVYQETEGIYREFMNEVKTYLNQKLEEEEE